MTKRVLGPGAKGELPEEEPKASAPEPPEEPQGEEPEKPSPKTTKEG